MTRTTRRYFIKVSAAAGGAFGLGIKSRILFAEKAVTPLRILILGGTGFTGPYQVRYALSRGHKVTTFNRGKTHPGELPTEVEQLIGDRNGKLDALKGRQWDVVIDNPTTLPAWVRDAAQILKGNVERYVFISTISVYGEVKTGPDETTSTEKYEGADPYKATLDAMKAGGYKTYGPLKALSEREAEKWFPGKTLIVRPGLIVGPRDETIASHIGQCGLIAVAKCSRLEVRTIPSSSSTRAILQSGPFGWWKTAKPEFTTRLDRPNRLASAACSTESKMR
jgi:Nucleoside-diphosphate-sugar epimerases